MFFAFGWFIFNPGGLKARKGKGGKRMRESGECEYEGEGGEEVKGVRHQLCACKCFAQVRRRRRARAFIGGEGGGGGRDR